MNKNITQKNNFSVLIFDLDGTLYDADNGYIKNQKNNILEFLVEQEISDKENVEIFWNNLFTKYNQTLRGLQNMGYKIDKEIYWEKIRKDTKKFIKKDIKLRDFIESLPLTQKKYIFTNCNEKQAIECLDCLGILHLFDGIYGAEFMGDKCKPEIEVYKKLLNVIGNVEPEKCCMFEDSFKNLETAKKMGMSTVLIKSKITQEKDCVKDKNIIDCIIDNLSQGKNIKNTYPRLYL